MNKSFFNIQNCYQGTRSVSTYTEEFLRLQTRCNLNENEDHQVMRYMNGLNYSVQDYLAMQGIWSVDQAQNLALRAECIIQSKKTLKVPMNPQFDPNTKASSSRIENKFADSWGNGGETKKPEPKERQGATQRIRCFKCKEQGHKSNKCPRRKFVNITQHEFEGDYAEHNMTEEDCNYEVAEKDGDEVVCVVRRLLYTPAQADESQRKRIFEGKCSVTNRVCKLVINSCSCENLVSQSRVEHLSLIQSRIQHLITLGG
jgi:hypothetical protein